MPLPELDAMAKRMADAGVALTVLPSTDLYLGGRERDHRVERSVADANRLHRLGVTCSISSNNILNAFTPMGDGQLIRMANLYANIVQHAMPGDLRDTWGMFTTNSAKLMRRKDYGIAVGNPADLVVWSCEDAGRGDRDGRAAADGLQARPARVLARAAGAAPAVSGPERKPPGRTGPAVWTGYLIRFRTIRATPPAEPAGFVILTVSPATSKLRGGCSTPVQLGNEDPLGVEIKTNSPLGPGLTIDDLMQDGFKAVFLGVGAQKSMKLGIEGEDLNGVIHGVDYLREIKAGKEIPLGNRVAVIGGGNVAIDVVRTALRKGSKEAFIIYRRSREEMPALEEEIIEAEEEGVTINYLLAPRLILGENGRVSGIRCVRMELGEADESGRRRPVPFPGLNVSWRLMRLSRP